MVTRNVFQAVILALICSIVLPAVLLAMPAHPELREFLQPDGQVVKIRQWGDENSHGWETDAGYTVVRNDSLNGWTYAVIDQDGRLTASSILVNPSAPPPAGISRRLRPHKASSSQLKKKISHTGSQLTAPVTGTKSLPVLLVSFSDQSFVKSQADFNNLLFGSNGYTMKNYYLENSLNQLTVSGGASGVYGPVTVSKPHDYYGKNDSQGNDLYPGALVYEAVSLAAAAGYKFAPFVDQSKGCYVETVIIAHQGTGEEAGYNDNDIWSHSWELNSANTFEKYKTGNGEFVTNEPCSSGGFIKVNKYVIQPELAKNDGTMIGVGVFAHEFGHALGLPDLYDTDNSSEGAGDWTLMAGGSWLGATGYGETPSHLDAWSKLYLGWISPETVSGTMTGKSINASSGTSPNYYQLGTGTATSGEFFLIENRQKSGFDKYLPGSGLLVWHIDGNYVSSHFSANTINNTECTSAIAGACSATHYGVALVQADNAMHLEFGKNRGDAFDPFYAGNKTTISDSTSPGITYWNGTASGFVIADIGASAATMTATFNPVSAGVDGVCGTSNGGTFATAPTTNLCSQGTATTPTGAGPWYWTCAGSNGGTAANCSANMSGGTSGNIIQNPGFESGIAGWGEFSSGNYELIYNKAGTGNNNSNWYAVLGGYDNAKEYIYQNVDIPANATSALLDFYAYIASGEGTTTAYDFLYVAVADPPTNMSLTNIGYLSNKNQSSGWKHYNNVDLSAYKGKSIGLFFYATTDSASPTTFFIDDVNLAITSLSATHAVTPSAGANGTISPNTVQQVQNGSTATFTITPNSGYKTVTPIGGTCPQGSLNASTYTTGAVTSDCTVTPAFEAISIAINGVCGSSNGGTFATAPTTNLCDQGTPTAPTGTGPWYWTCLGSNGGAAASCSAAKAATSYTVTFQSGGNGAISGNSSQTVTSGGSATQVTAVPANGYHFVSWTGTGGFVATTANPLTVTNVASSMIITANFAQNQVPVNGICGSSNGGTFDVAPTANLCAQGSATTLTGTGPWYWTCLGSNGGTTTNCSAAKPANNPGITVTSPVPASYPYKVAKGTISFIYSGSLAMEQILAAISTSDSWLRISSVKFSKGSGTIAYIVEANNGPLRSGTISVAGTAIAITQNAPPCKITSVTVSPSTVLKPGGDVTVNVVVAPEFCSWSVASVKPGGEWLTGLTEKNVTGSGSITGNVMSNESGKPRSTVATIITSDEKAKKNVTVRQAK